MRPQVDVRVIRPHTRECLADEWRGSWKLDSRWSDGGGGDAVRIVHCDRIGRVGNGGRVFYVLCCTSSWRCNAEAIVSKGWLLDHARAALEVVSS